MPRLLRLLPCAALACSGGDATADPTTDPGGAASTGQPSTDTTGAPDTTTAPTRPTTDAPTTDAPTTDAPTTGTTGPDDPVASDCEVAPCFNVINKCGFPLWIHAANNADVVLQPDGVTLPPGGVQQYPVPAEWPAGRVNAHYADPRTDPAAHDKVEITVTGGVMNYNITYVDYVSLPAEMQAVGPECQPTPEFDPKIGCYVPRAEILRGCPDDLRTGDRCLSASLYCDLAEHKDLPYCHALDEQIAACAELHPETCGVAAQLGDLTPQVYACSGYFDSQPPNCGTASETCHAEGNRWCAALNRGMLADPENPDSTQYYQSPPYNTYAKWVHDTCPGIYAFAYDDYPANAGESGFRACKADRLDITFCPAG
jgi:hypothetical protein